MKKRLLTQIFAMLCAVGAYALGQGDYVYNTTQRFKLLGDNLVTNGDFTDGLTGWTDVEGGEPSAEVWSVEPGVGPNGENVLQSLANTEGFAVCRSWTPEPGTYVVMLDIKGNAYTNTALASTTTTINANTVDFFVNTSADEVKKSADAVNVAAATHFDAEWTRLVFVATIEDGQALHMYLEKLVSGTQITNIGVYAAQEVYDIRTIEKRIAFVQKLMDDPNFNIAGAEGPRAELADNYIAGLQGMMESGELDDPDTAESLLAEFNDAVDNYLDVASVNVAKNTYFNYVEDLTAFPKYNRGGISNGQQIGGFVFRGGNWLHSSGGTTLTKQIQGSFSNGDGSVGLTSTLMPAAKYYIAAEVRNAYCDKNYVLSYNLENEVKAFVGTDSVDCGTIVGEDYVKFYMVGTIKDGETMEAGFKWFDNAGQGTRFDITNFEVRCFDKGFVEQYERTDIWNKFIAQWNAAVSAREAVVAAQTNVNYPWAKDSLVAALAQWDPLYNAQVAKNWVNEAGEDTGVATNDELVEWTTHQGYYPAEEDADFGTYGQYALVRGYQYATNYVKAANQKVADLVAEIEKAEQTLDNDLYSSGDKTTFQTAINHGKALLDEIRQSSNDAQREADEARIDTEIATLEAAIEAFIASGANDPIVDIDFSNGFVENAEDGSYTIAGTAGTMMFPAGSVQLDNTVADMLFALGHNGEKEDVLHVSGSNYATVALPEVPTDEEAINVKFDLFFGQLGGGYLDVILENAAGECVAGFSFDSYNGVDGYNDFNNEENTGMAVKGHVDSAHDKGAGGAIDVVADSKRNSFELTLDFKARVVQGTVTRGNGTVFAGGEIPMKDLEDNKVTTFKVGCGADDGTATYAKANSNAPGRRCWFDNLKIYKYNSSKESGIATVAAERQAAAGIYTLTGVKLSAAPQKGLYIQNGKKYVVK